MPKKISFILRMLAVSAVLTVLVACDSAGLFGAAGGRPIISLPVKLVGAKQDSDLGTCYLEFQMQNTSTHHIGKILFDVVVYDKQDKFLAKNSGILGIRNTRSGANYVDSVHFENTNCRDIGNINFQFRGGEIVDNNGNGVLLKGANLVM